jgi:hypothetical protein
MITCKHELDNDVKWAELELVYINSAVIAFKNEELDLEVYINVKDLSYNEVYNNETLYELVERLGGDIIEAYQSGEEL